MNEYYLSKLTQEIINAAARGISSTQHQELFMITELIKIIGNKKRTEADNNLLSDLATSFKKNLNIHCDKLLNKDSKKNIDSNLAALSKEFTKDYKKLLSPYFKDVKKIYKKNKRSSSRTNELHKRREKFKLDLAKIRSDIFLYCISGNKTYFNQMSQLNFTIDEQIKLGTRIPYAFIEELIPRDDEIVEELAEDIIIGVEKSSEKLTEKLFENLGYPIGSATHRRKLEFNAEEQQKINISDEQLEYFISEVKNHRV